MKTTVRRPSLGRLSARLDAHAEMARRVGEAIERADLLALADLMVHEDVVVRLAWGERLQGRAALQAFFAKVSRRTRALEVKITGRFVEPDGFGLAQRIRREVQIDGPGVAAGTMIDIESFWRFRVEDGLIREAEHFVELARIQDRAARQEASGHAASELVGLVVRGAE